MTRTLVEALLAAPHDRPFVTMWHSPSRQESLTFGAFIAAAQAQAAGLRAQGIGPGDRVVLILPPGVPLLTLFVGALWVGAVPAILAYPNFKVEPAKYQAGLVGVTANLRARLVVVDADFPPALRASITLPVSAELVTLPAIPPAHSLFPPAPVSPDAVAFIQHSSGATGLQKGVALTHRAVLRQLDHLAEALAVTQADAVYSWLPLYHDMGLIACFLLPLVRHLRLVMQSPVSWVLQPATMLELISQARCTLVWLPNFAFQFLARQVRPAQRAGLDLSCLRVVTNCSEPVRYASMREFETALADCGLRPGVVQTSYALAENVFAVTHSLAAATPLTPLWVDAGAWRCGGRVVEAAPQTALPLLASGACLAGNAVRIVSADGSPAPPGHVGAILIHSDSLFEGYDNRPDLNAQVWQDGWYRTGDLGFCWQGQLYVTGRAADRIIVGGKNLYAQDIEAILCAHPAIHDGRALALGVYNPALGTEDILCVAEVEDPACLNEPLPLEQALRQRVLAELDVAVKRIYLKPRAWLVKSTAGKPARAATRAKLWRDHPELVSRYPESDDHVPDRAYSTQRA